MDFQAELATTNENLANFREMHPLAAGGFTKLHNTTMYDGDVSLKHKELIALAIGIVRQCADCIGFHVRAAIKAGATKDEIAETVGVCIFMGGGPAYMYGARALEAYDQFMGEAAGA